MAGLFTYIPEKILITHHVEDFAVNKAVLAYIFLMMLTSTLLVKCIYNYYHFVRKSWKNIKVMYKYFYLKNQ